MSAAETGSLKASVGFWAAARDALTSADLGAKLGESKLSEARGDGRLRGQFPRGCRFAFYFAATPAGRCKLREDPHEDHRIREKASETSSHSRTDFCLHGRLLPSSSVCVEMTLPLFHDFWMEAGCGIDRFSQLIGFRLLPVPRPGNFRKQSPSCNPRHSPVSQPCPWYEASRKRESRSSGRAGRLGKDGCNQGRPSATSTGGS
jgi:hypothetical protein